MASLLAEMAKTFRGDEPLRHADRWSRWASGAVTLVRQDELTERLEAVHTFGAAAGLAGVLLPARHALRELTAS